MPWHKKLIFLTLSLSAVIALINHRWIRYVGHLAKHQVRVLLYKEKITERLKRKDLKPGERRALEVTLAIRKFAEERYGLAGSKSYQSFYDLGRKELGFNITLAPALSLKPESFHFFPIGSFDYLGFFDKDYAESWANEYRSKGFDVHLAEIGGYSTLGWFDDPLYSSQLEWREAGLARLLGHEIAHERLYFKNDTAFSELLASFIEDKIATDYLAHYRRPFANATRRQDYEKKYREFSDLVMTLRENLQKIYAADLSDAEKLRRKKTLISGLQQELTVRKEYFKLRKIPEINNAWLVQFHRYTPKGKAFENLFNHCKDVNPASVYVCWFDSLEKLRSLSREERQNWLKGSGAISLF